MARVAITMLITAGCSSGSATSDPAEVPEATESAQPVATATLTEPTATVSTATPPTAPTPAPTQPVDDMPEPVATAAEPAVRLPENPGTVEATNWMGRNAMDAESVDLIWSEVEGAEVYRVYRIRTFDADYDAIQQGDLSGTALVYEGSAVGYLDRDVESDTFLTYVLVAQIGNDLTSPRWTEALTIDDTTPPTPITGLVASNTPDGVLLEWQPSSDDVEFASYSVTILDGDRPRYIGGGADESQTSFLDTDTSAGTRTYQVTAVDFHDNQSEPAQVEITR